MSGDSDIYDASDNEHPKFGDKTKDGSKDTPEGRSEDGSDDTSEDRFGGRFEDRFENMSEDDEPIPYEEATSQPRICTVCYNLKLFVNPTGTAATDFLAQTTQTVMNGEIVRDRIKTQCMDRIEFYELLESARIEECAYCMFLFNCLRTEEAEPDEGRSTIVRVIARSGQPWYIYWDDKNNGPKGVEVYAEKGTIPALPELGSAAELAARSFADPVFTQIRDWLKDCEVNHPGCPRISSSPPRRLIDVGVPTPPKGRRKIRLVEDHMDPVKYIALSHCWGSEQNFTTTIATREARLDEIAWNDLPKTYRDAVKVARKLHIRYLWIDSLCILQDDEDDWDVESAKMAMTYQDSYLTLAAALSPSDSQGFLGLDDSRLLYTSSPVKSLPTTRIRKIHDYRSINTPNVLSSRAWTMQERIIPQRLLTFSLGISFQCRQADWCECGSGLFPDLVMVDPDTWRRLDRAICQAALDSESNPEEIYHFWLNGIVVPYSQKKLTRMSDRLPAISALAQKFQLKLDESYLAGLWEKDLICGLSWFADDVIESDHRDMSDRAPSWSWASVEGPVRFGYINERSDRPRRPNLRLRFAEWTVNPRGFNVFGEVESGTLRAVGPALRCFLTLEAQGPETKYTLIPLLSALEDAVVTVGLKLDCPLEETEIIEDNGQTTGSLNRCKWDKTDTVGGEVLCLLLYQLRQEALYFVREYLVLGRCAKGPDFYQRLGLLRVSSSVNQLWFGELSESEAIIV